MTDSVNSPRPRHNYCGPIIEHRDWRNIEYKKRTRAERVMSFCEDYCIVPEGSLVGQKIRLAYFQEDFIYSIYDNPHVTRNAYLSIARKNAKTATIAMLLLAHLVGPERSVNSQIISGALSREQAALVFTLAAKMVGLSEKLSSVCYVQPSYKRIKALLNGSEYRALAADGKTAHGLSPVLAILDEVGQIVGPSSPFIDAITSSQGAYENPLLIAISTSASSDSDMFSKWIDDASSSQDPHTVCHVYKSEEGCNILDESQWELANPALGIFRSKKDLEEQLKKASRIPSQETSARNLLLNQRISQRSVWISPQIWKENNRPLDPDLLKTRVVNLGLDLSMRNDLTAAVFSVLDDEGFVHLFPHVFIPENSLEEKELRDKAPYRSWARNGKIILVPGRTIDYEWVARYLRSESQGMTLGTIEFDRWGIEQFKQACLFSEWHPIVEWSPVGQGYKDFSPRLKAFETALMKGKIAHGDHPLLNMSVQNAISVSDPAGNIKLDKAQSSLRIDPIVAAVMSAFPLLDGRRANIFSVDGMIG
jgi:phage terminase large subunit-like protein